MKKREKGREKEAGDIEKILDSLWDNWSSRRKCESTHIPEYLKKQED